MAHTSALHTRSYFHIARIMLVSVLAILVCVPVGSQLALSLLVMPLHEGGHALVIWLMGFEISQIQLGIGDELASVTIGGVNLFIGKSWGGNVQFYIDENLYYLPFIAFIHIAGAVVPLLVGALCIRLARGTAAFIWPYLLFGVQGGFLISYFEQLLVLVELDESDGSLLRTNIAVNLPESMLDGWYNWGYTVFVVAIASWFVLQLVGFMGSIIKARVNHLGDLQARLA